MSEPRVAVVGGGLAGLAAATACVDAGVRVTLIESRPRLGGATYSFRRDGLRIDNGQHVFLRCCTAYRGFLDRLGVTQLTALQDRMSIQVREPGGRTGVLERSRLPAPLHLARALARYPFIGWRDRFAIARAARRLGGLDTADPALDERSFGSWLTEQRQSPAAVAALWDLIALPTLNLPAADASLALAAKVFRTGLLDDASAADVGYAHVPLDELHAGPAARLLDAAGADVRLAAPVRTIEDGAVRGDGWVQDADAIVLAVPHDAAAELLDEPQLRTLGHSPIVNVHAVYDRPVTDVAFCAGLGTCVQWVFDRTRSAGLDNGQYLAVSVSGADGWIDRRTDEIREAFVPALEALFPAACDARLVSFFVTRERDATFRQAPRTKALRPGPRTRFDRVFVAGAWTDTGWPATMEGAVRSGLAAAREALVALGRTRALPEVAAA